ncbi:ABC transporter ATP-binding protein [Lachnospiraceae bacterium 47-T17]
MSSFVKVQNVSKQFGRKVILRDVSFTVAQGETIGLVGANGSGKSVLFKILCGFETPDSGKVYVRGKQLGKGGRDFPENMGVFINSPGFIGIYSGFQNLKFLAAIQGKIGNKEIQNAMEKVGLDPGNKTKVDNYSLGMKQKLGLAQAIMEGQDILVLDEPFNALDIKTYEDVKSIIRMLTAEGKTIFLTSHHYKDIEQLCSRIYTIDNCSVFPVTEEIAKQYREIE